MGKKIVFYNGILRAGKPIFIYEDLSDYSESIEVRNGSHVKLPIAYEEESRRGMYRIIYPKQGWVVMQYVTEIEPVYETTTDKCAPPSKVILEVDKNQLTIQGGAGGDLNKLEGFGVSYRERGVGSSAWGSWSSDEVITVRKRSVRASDGMERQFRVRTRGSAGKSYFSEYITCGTSIVGKLKPGTPVITLPEKGARTFQVSSVVFLTVSADQDGDTMKIMRKVDDGEWQERSTVQIESGNFLYKDSLYDIGFGEHDIAYKIVDINDAVTGEDSVHITKEIAEWTREIYPGDVISNKEISHVKDIVDMLEKLNVVRNYYNLPKTNLPGIIGRFSDWKEQMETMKEAINEFKDLGDQARLALGLTPDWPDASTILTIQIAITE